MPRPARWPRSRMAARPRIGATEIIPGQPDLCSRVLANNRQILAGDSSDLAADPIDPCLNGLQRVG
jgi:hypothetical protein